MQKLFSLFLIFIGLGCQPLYAQCPNTSFQAPDTACVGTPITISNTSTVGLNNEWDLCNGDLSLNPTGANIGNIGSLVFPQQIELVKDNGKYFAFIANYVANTVTRLNFGSSPTNTPTVFSYGTVGGLLAAPCAVDLIKDNGNWYMLVANFNAKNIIRINLGSLIENNTSSGVDLGLFNLDKPKNIEIARDSANYYAFVTNQLGNNLIKISFGTSMGNTPSFTSLTDPLFAYNNGIDIQYDCALNKYFALVASSSGNKINMVDFGTSLANPGTIASSINCLTFPTGLDVVRDGNNWHIIVTGSFNKIQNIRIPGNLLNTPQSIFNDTLGALSDVTHLSVIKDSSKVFGFAISSGPNTLSRYQWPDNCNSSPGFSTDPTGLTATFNNPGYGMISLQVTDTISNITNYYTDSVFMSPTPVSGFFTNPACEGLPVVFTDSSSIAAGTIDGWEWDFGDSSPVDISQNPSHTYASNGSYTVSLITTSNSGCSDSSSAIVTVSPLPAADFSFINNQCTGVEVSFTDLSLAFSGATIAEWNWDFGDGTPADTIQNAVHTFTLSGTYTITLTATASTGCVDSISQQITIIPSPENSFSVSETCLGETVVFTNTTTIQGGGSLNYEWNFGDNSTSTSINPTHQYALTSGNYDVTLIGIATNGCTDTLVQSIKISNQPIPQFTWTPTVVCEGNQVSFTSQSTGTGGDTISAYIWDFGDTGTSDLENPFHVYADTGFYDVTLTVVSPTSCDSSITQQVYVIAGPSATFTANNVCLNLTTNFNPSVTTPPGTQVDSIAWNFGDGTLFTGLTSPIHTYLSPGRYGVTMTVYNDLLCTGSFIDSVDVFPLPLASYTTTLSCSASPTGFNGSSSSVIGDSITSWLWNFAGQGSSTDTIPEFIFPNAGTFNVTLIVTTSNGCSDTLQTPVSVIQSPQFDFVYNEPCLGQGSLFTYNSLTTPPPPANLTWNFGDGTLSFLLSPSHIYATVDTFDVVLTVENPNTLCTTKVTKPLIVFPLPNAGYIINNNCEDLPLQFTDTTSIQSGSVVSWNWNLGSLGTSTLSNPVVIPIDAGTYLTTLTVTSDKGCVATVSKSATVFSKPNAAFTTDPLFGSPPLTISIINTTTGATNYNWDFGDGFPGTGFSPQHIYQDTGLFNVTMIASSAEGCLDTAYSIVSVLIPDIDIGVNKIYSTRDGNSITLTAELINAGNVMINEFSIKGEIEEGSIISENWTGSFAPGTIIIYKFNSSYEVASTFIPQFFCIEVFAPNDTEDMNPLNNKKCQVLNNEFEIFSSYPNPFDEIINVNFNLNTAGEFSINMYDELGKLVTQRKNLSGLGGFNSAFIDTEQLSKGTYTLQIIFRDDRRSTKVIKLK